MSQALRYKKSARGVVVNCHAIRYTVLEREGVMTFGQWLYSARTAAKFSQEELAEAAGCSKNYISALERDLPHHKTGRPSIPTPDLVRSLAIALGKSEEEAILAAYMSDPRADVEGPNREYDVNEEETMLAFYRNAAPEIKRSAMLLLEAGVKYQDRLETTIGRKAE